MPATPEHTPRKSQLTPGRGGQPGRGPRPSPCTPPPDLVWAPPDWRPSGIPRERQRGTYLTPPGCKARETLPQTHCLEEEEKQNKNRIATIQGESMKHQFPRRSLRKARFLSPRSEPVNPGPRGLRDARPTRDKNLPKKLRGQFGRDRASPGAGRRAPTFRRCDPAAARAERGPRPHPLLSARGAHRWSAGPRADSPAPRSPEVFPEAGGRLAAAAPAPGAHPAGRPAPVARRPRLSRWAAARALPPDSRLEGVPSHPLTIC